MFKLTHGLRIKCRIKGIDVNDAMISIDSASNMFICQDICNGAPTSNKFKYRYSYVVAYDTTSRTNGQTIKSHNIKPIMSQVFNRRLIKINYESTD